MALEIVPRKNWVHPSSKTPRALTRKIGLWQGDILHWQGTKFQVTSQADEIRILNNILNYHLGKKGKNSKWAYNDIAYGWAIGRYGHVYELRGDTWVQGAHSPENSTSRAILMLYSTDEQIPETMKRTYVEFRLHSIAKGLGTEVRDHNAVTNTACAGDPARRYIRELYKYDLIPAPIHEVIPIMEQKTILARITTDENGRGYVDVNPRLGKNPVCISVLTNGRDPKTENYSEIFIGNPIYAASTRGNILRVEVAGAKPRKAFDIRVTAGKT